jgi:hypothetical protein
MGNKKTCGLIVPSSCVPWVGVNLLSFDSKSMCDPVIEEIVAELDKALHVIQETLDTAQINPGCIALPSSGKWYDIATTIYAELCTLRSRIDALQPQAINVGNMPVTVNMECMSGNCATTAPTVSQLFEMIIHKICVVESRLNVIDPSNNTNGDVLFQPT